MDELGIGIMVRFGCPPEESFARLRNFGLAHCQLAAPPDEYIYGAEGRRNTRLLQNAIEEYGVTVTSLFISFPDQDWEDWKNGIGLVPPATRAARLARACRSADWGRELGIEQIASHVGCVPEDPADPIYAGFVRDMRPFVKLLEANRQVLAYETGQESVAALARLIDDIGEENQRVNFDPANLLIYDHDDPMRLLERLGDRIVHFHCKDGKRPVDGAVFGKETVLGVGDTDFRKLFLTMYARGYRGPLTIEREIPAGPELDRDLGNAIVYLENLKRDAAAGAVS